MVAERKGDYGPAPKTAMPYGFMVGFSKDVLRMVPRCKMGGKAKDLLTLIIADAFGDAGREKEHPEEAGLWCNTNNAAWAAGLGCKKQYVSQVIGDLESYGIVTRHQATEVEDWKTFAPQRLRLEPDFTKWLPLQEAYALSRYTRQGAGRPRKIPAERKSLDIGEATTRKSFDSDSHTPLTENEVEQVQPDMKASGQNPPLTISRISKDLRVVDKTYSQDLPVVASDDFSGFTPASLEGLAGSAAEAPVIRVTEEEEKETKAPSAPEADASPGFVWPLRQAHEKSDLDYYQRILLENEKQRIPLLTRMAHERIGSNPAAYGRIGSLAKKCGASLLAKYILQAAASHIDGDDPLSYLTQIVKRQEGTNGTRTGTGKRETYQPKTAAGADGTGAGSNDGDGWAGWNHHKYTVTSTGVAVDQDGNTW